MRWNSSSKSTITCYISFSFQIFNRCTRADHKVSEILFKTKSIYLHSSSSTLISLPAMMAKELCHGAKFKIFSEALFFSPDAFAKTTNYSKVSETVHCFSLSWKLKEWYLWRQRIPSTSPWHLRDFVRFFGLRTPSAVHWKGWPFVSIT